MAQSQEFKPPLHIGWQVFWGLLFLPAIVLIVSVFLLLVKVDASQLGLVWILIVPLCSLYCGIWAGIKLGAHDAKNPAFIRLALQTIISVVLIIFIAGINYIICIAAVDIFGSSF